MKSWWLVVAGFCVFGCGERSRQSPAAPAGLVGDFEDDYGNRYTISDTLWSQPPARYRVTRWDTSGRFLLARNDSANLSAPGMWTRIDWLVLDMAPWTWAFCYSAYDAATADAAESVTVRRDTPRTGCNGYPFSRMKRVEPS